VVTLGGYGVEWIVDASGCTPARLTDRRALDGVFASVVEALGLHPVGRASWHRFPVTRGLTGLLMLKESHLACHTFPEFGGACFNLYCCRPRPAWPWREELESRLGAARVVLRTLRRSYASPREASA